MTAEELLAGLEEKGRVTWPDARLWAEGCRLYLILEKSAKGPAAGSLTFSEFRRGLDRNLREYVMGLRVDWKKYAGKIFPLPEPWVIRVQSSRKGENGAWDWVWTGGETMDLVGEQASRMSECFVTGIGVAADHE